MRGTPAAMAASRTRSVVPTFASHMWARSDFLMPTTYEPAPWMTASALFIWAVMAGTLCRSLATSVTFLVARNCAFDGSRTSATTSSPRSASRLTTARPMNPAPPVTTTRKYSPADALQLPNGGRRVDGLQPALDLGHELARLRTVGGAVVEAKAHEHLRADGDRVAGQRFDDDRALADRLEGQDADLRRVDDRRRDDRAGPAGVVEREGAALDVVELEAAAAGPVGEIPDLAVEAMDRQPVRIVDDRHDQAVLDRYGHAQVHPVAQPVTFIGVVRVEVRVPAQGLDGRLGDEGVEAQADAFARLVGALVRVAQRNHARHVDFNDGVGHGHLDRARHLRSDRLAHGRGRLERVFLGRRRRRCSSWRTGWCSCGRGRGDRGGRGCRGRPGSRSGRSRAGLHLLDELLHVLARNPPGVTRAGDER